MRLISHLTLLIFLLSALGCGSDIEGGNDGNTFEPPENEPEGPIETPDFQSANFDLIAAYCEKTFECCSGDQMEELFGEAYSDVDECVSEQRGPFSAIGAVQLEASYREGRIEYSEGHADACKTQVNQLSCSDFEGTPTQRESLPGCEEMIEGVVELGGNCQGDWECESDYCVNENPEEEQMGTCAELPGLGEECPDRRCGGLGYCTAVPPLPEDGDPDMRCDQLRQAGEACTEDKMCNSGYCGVRQLEENSGSTERVCMDPPTVCQ